MKRDLFDILKENSFLQQLLETLREQWNLAMSALEEAMGTSVVTAKATT